MEELRTHQNSTVPFTPVSFSSPNAPHTGHGVSPGEFLEAGKKFRQQHRSDALWSDQEQIASANLESDLGRAGERRGMLLQYFSSTLQLHQNRNIDREVYHFITTWQFRKCEQSFRNAVRVPQ